MKLIVASSNMHINFNLANPSKSLHIRRNQIMPACLRFQVSYAWNCKILPSINNDLCVSSGSQKIMEECNVLSTFLNFLQIVFCTDFFVGPCKGNAPYSFPLYSILKWYWTNIFDVISNHKMLGNVPIRVVIIRFQYWCFAYYSMKCLVMSPMELFYWDFSIYLVHITVHPKIAKC